MIANIEKEIKYFKSHLLKAIHVFFELKKKYENDDNSVLVQINSFKGFIKQFNEKYQNIIVSLDDSDFTPDDLKIFIINYSSKEALLEKFKLVSSPLLIKLNSKYNKLQAFLNYKHLDENFSQDLELLAMIAIENQDYEKRIILPKELEKIGTMNNKYSAKDSVLSSSRLF